MDGGKWQCQDYYTARDKFQLGFLGESIRPLVDFGFACYPVLDDRLTHEWALSLSGC